MPTYTSVIATTFPAIPLARKVVYGYVTSYAAFGLLTQQAT